MDLLSADQIQFCEGWVSHTRPRIQSKWKNAFRYPIFNLLVPVHEEVSVQELEGRFAISLSAGDYLYGNDGSLDKNIRAFLGSELDYACDAIWLQTLPRMCGYGFNPVSFWFCHRKGKLNAVLCEVNNTFGDRHFYFIRDIDQSPLTAHRLPKRFHVSPFFEISGEYEFEFQLSPSSSDVRIRLFQGAQLRLDTRIKLETRPFQEVSTFFVFRKYGWMTAMVIARIHFQGLRLWFKNFKFVRRPMPPAQSTTDSNRLKHEIS